MSDIQVTLSPANITVQFPVSQPGAGVPEGGTAGQIIVKDSSVDFHTSWRTFAQFLNNYSHTLPQYDSDESAVTGGLSVGDFYITAPNHVTLPGGVLKRLQ